MIRLKPNLVWLSDGEDESPDRGRVYAMGGLLPDNEVTATVEVLDFHYDVAKKEWVNEQDSWRLSAPMLKPRWEFGALAHRGMIICVCGKSAGREPTNSVEIYDPKLGQWTYMMDSPGFNDVLSFTPCSRGILKIGMAVFTLKLF